MCLFLLSFASLSARPSLNPQQSLKAEPQALEEPPAQLPILADMLLYYCRFAARPVLLQVYQTEVRPLAAPSRRSLVSLKALVSIAHPLAASSPVLEEPGGPSRGAR